MLDTLAKLFLFKTALISDDFPTFERPANATSGLVLFGSCEVKPYDAKYSARSKLVAYVFVALAELGI